MTQPKLGIDIAKETYQASLIVNGKTFRRSFHNRSSDFAALSKWLAKHSEDQMHVCMEATGTFWETLATYLHLEGHVVSVVNPARIRNYGRSKLIRNKTDKLDADVIADFCLTQSPPPWTPPPAEIRELRLLVRRLDDLQTMRTQEANRLSSGVASVQVIQTIETHLAFLDQQIKDLEREIEDHIDQYPELRRQRDLLVSIKGIGAITAARLLAENISAFTSTRALVAYAGLNPQFHDSGTSVHGKPHLSKIGNSNLRKALYFPAISAMRFNPVVYEFCQRLKQRSKHNMVIISAAMRKLLCLALGVLKSGVPFDPDYAQFRVSAT